MQGDSPRYGSGGGGPMAQKQSSVTPTPNTAARHPVTIEPPSQRPRASGLSRATGPDLGKWGLHDEWFFQTGRGRFIEPLVMTMMRSKVSNTGSSGGWSHRLKRMLATENRAEPGGCRSPQACMGGTL